MTKPASRPFDTFSPAHHGLYLDNFELKDDDEDNDDGGGRDDDDLRWASRPFVLRCTYSNLKVKNILQSQCRHNCHFTHLTRDKFAMYRLHHEHLYCMQMHNNIHYE